MPPSTPTPSLTDSLLALKTQYERSLAEANTKASHLREQLSHVNALLLDRLLFSNGVVPQQTQSGSDVPVEAIAPASAKFLAISPAPEAPAPIPKTKANPEPTPASGKRSPRPLLPAYQGLTRLEAIAQILQTTPGQDVTTEQVSEGLFGKLSAAEYKAERKSLNTQLYKGQSLKLWQKGTILGTYTIGAPTPSKSTNPEAPTPKAKALATTASKRKSLTLLPAYVGLTKGEAIAQVLGQYPGKVLHHDTIIQTLYGDLSPEELKAERVRIKTALLTGIKDGKWQKASVPSSYFIKATAASAKPNRPERKPETSKEPKPEPEATAQTKPATTKQRSSLEVLPAFEGITKLNAIAKVLAQHPGEVLHQDTIIQTLYGDLSPEDLKKERVRMDTSLRNGIKTNKWKKAPVPASYVLEAIAPALAAKAKAAKPRSERKPAIAKAKASEKTARPQRTEAELVEMLHKADIQV